MRAELVEAMIRDGYSAGIGALLAGIAAALDALDCDQPSSLSRPSLGSRSQGTRSGGRY
jgi:hypothetical protein